MRDTQEAYGYANGNPVSWTDPTGLRLAIDVGPIHVQLPWEDKKPAEKRYCAVPSHIELCLLAHGAGGFATRAASAQYPGKANRKKRNAMRHLLGWYAMLSRGLTYDDIPGFLARHEDGVVLDPAHPNSDGWADSYNNQVSFVFAQFCDKLGLNDDQAKAYAVAWVEASITKNEGHG